MRRQDHRDVSSVLGLFIDFVFGRRQGNGVSPPEEGRYHRGDGGEGAGRTEGAPPTTRTSQSWSWYPNLGEGPVSVHRIPTPTSGSLTSGVSTESRRPRPSPNPFFSRVRVVPTFGDGDGDGRGLEIPFTSLWGGESGPLGIPTEETPTHLHPNPRPLDKKHNTKLDDIKTAP